MRREKATAELGLVLRTLDELGLGLDVFPVKPEPGQLDLDDLFGNDGGKHG